jgi:palmitoyltransferase
VVLCFFLAFTLALLVTAFFAFHLYLMNNNYTTIEFCEKRKDKEQFRLSPYNKGFCHNFRLVLGHNPLLWLIPVAPEYEGAGLFFEVREDLTS